MVKLQAKLRCTRTSNMGETSKYTIDVAGDYKNISSMTTPSDIFCIILFNDALDVVKNKFTGLPMVHNTESVQFHGDLARFIAANISKV